MESKLFKENMHDILPIQAELCLISLVSLLKRVQRNLRRMIPKLSSMNYEERRKAPDLPTPKEVEVGG